MGSSQSALSPLRTRMEPEGSPNLVEPPKQIANETAEQKLYRKFSSQPLIPIGCMITVYYLGSGIKSFYNRDAQRSQKMMRARVAAQFMTLAIFVAYTGFGEFDFTIAPMYQRAKQHEQALTADKEGETKEAK